MPSKPAPRVIRLVTAAFFVGLVVIGVAVFDDYGISWDEIPTREFGVMNVEGLVADRQALDSVRRKLGATYERFGPLYEIALVSAEKAFTSDDARATMLMRHLVTYLVYLLGAVLFYVLCARRFSPGIALLAAVGFVASPALFSHAFYNTKDIPFLTAFVATMLTLDRWLISPSRSTFLVHALTTLVLMGMRILGLFAVLVTAAAALARRPTRRTILELAAHVAIVVILLPVVWPVLRVDPVGIVKGAVAGTVSNMYSGANLFRGAIIPAESLPWDYFPTWMLVTIPPVLTLLFVTGVTRLGASVVTAPREHVSGERQRDLIVAGWFFVPMLGTMILRPVMYDAWRHLFFIYPAFIYLAAIGMEAVVTFLVARLGEPRRRLVHGAATVAFLAALAPALAFMVTSHPYQHLYFNRLAGRSLAEVKQRFELDYWGLSYREALEHIVESDTASVIRLDVANYPGVVNSVMLDPRDQARLRYVRVGEPADYFVTNYRLHPQDYTEPHLREVFSVRVDDASIASVFRIMPAR